jgi:pyruvate, water dikinase
MNAVPKTTVSPVAWFETLGRTDVASVGGKNASLGELVRTLTEEGISVPAGFATTANAYWRYVEFNGIGPTMQETLGALHRKDITIAQAGRVIRDAFLRGSWCEDLATPIREAYALLSRRYGATAVDVAVRSSATAEDLPDASFAGQQESFLNIRGEQALMDACRRCFASLFTDRAMTYREIHGFDHLKVALSIGVQKMVRCDAGAAGVMFTIDTETGYDKVVLIDAAWGLGENVVQGTVDPDEYHVFKPALENPGCEPIIGKRCGEKTTRIVSTSDPSSPTRSVDTSPQERRAFVLENPEILTLARWACRIERHYGVPMDIEWAKDGETGALFVVQARPETVQSRRAASAVMRRYRIEGQGRILLRGIGIGEAAVSGRVCRIESARDIERFVDGSILVTGTTDPDWVPVMKRAAALVTDHGGRTSHAAIVSRELGLTAIVGTGTATQMLQDGQDVTVSCAEGDQGLVYEGRAQIVAEDLDLASIPVTRTQVMLNLAQPESALRWWRLPADGVGLARMEFVIASHVKVHPMALLHYEQLDAATKVRMDELTRGYADRSEYFIETLARGLARIAAVRFPHPVIVRLSDFKTNEYAALLGGRAFEPVEENPMIGFRGASRYYSAAYREGFALECRALQRLRSRLGFTNVIVMVPFCRTPEEADRVLAVIAENGLKRSEDGLQVYVMCEIPSNVILAREFATRFDGFSIGSNDLTQLTLGVDRDCESLAELFDEENPAVTWMIRRAIKEAHAAGVKIGLCGQAPSDRPGFAAFLIECGIDSVSVSPDCFMAVKRAIATAETRRGG